MFEFSKESKLCLKSGGWSDGRKSDISGDLLALKEEGYLLLEGVEEIFSSLGGLNIIFFHSKKSEEDSFRIDAVAAIAGIFKDTVQLYEEVSGEIMIPIGNVFSGHMTLMLGQSGAVYAGFDETFILIGKSFSEAIDNICKGGSNFKYFEVDWDDDEE